jgi:hypothetical protein
MISKIKNQKSPKKIQEKLQKASAKSKKINWDKYFGKINFPVSALSYQQKMRNEWGK